MLQEERFIEILKIVDTKKSVTIQELMDKIGASESTIRRDLSVLHKAGKLVKVHGGAIAGSNYLSADMDVLEKSGINREEKEKIAKYAASLIDNKDFVYIDAGTTTELMIDYIKSVRAIFVTNAVSHALKLAKKGFTVYVPGGELKGITEAVIGEDTIRVLQNYNFTKGFFGVNGIDEYKGFTTPDIKEAQVKKQAVKQSAISYILADESKFDKVSPVTFCEFDNAVVLTGKLKNEKYKKYKNIKEV